MSRTFAVIVELDDDLRTDAPASAIVRVARASERAGVTAVSFEDHPTAPGAGAGAASRSGARFGRLDATLRAASVAPITSSIGLIPVVHALYNEPFHLATQLATLDTASLGRAGWIARADPDPSIAARHGRGPLPASAADAELADVVEAIRGVWDTWEDDAVIRDVATGRYLDRTKVHYADFVGDRFSVKGPSIIPRPPQGQPVVFGEPGSAAELDAVLLDLTLPGRDRPAAHLNASTDSTIAGAADLPELLGRATEAVDAARTRLAPGTLIVVQLGFALDSAGLSALDRLADERHHTRADARAIVTGDPSVLVDLLTALARVADGVRLFPASLEPDLDELGRAVLPGLRARGVFHSPLAGDSLRTSLGLERPTNRFESVAPDPLASNAQTLEAAR
ncbi:LLM class flavin-dependent oxidoreductase [Planctomonas sp. JC2975]|uniref:LLM class flavin-dependent oxidoreductase n=1 Tax=Planctomonas sp. JC2975 TaxID=2729626 RepID=UPI001476228A|nr:LLM class flavin-dependent oxidoreductase [Planctomonas sp. JC2975]NNC12314.1 LLM class flavin-dependent oxidoreductase [Planctomonas sp. JC2975]